MGAYLIDTDVRMNGFVLQGPIWVKTPLSESEKRAGWGHVMDSKRAYISAEPKKIRDDEVYRRENSQYVAGLARAAYEGKVRLYTSLELEVELTRNRRDRAAFFVDLFCLAEIEVLLGPMPRIETMSPPFCPNGADIRDNQMLFFKAIQHPRYEMLKKHLVNGDEHLADAFHFWTAEEAQLDGFITSEKRFWNVYDNQKRRINSKCKVMSPLEVCEADEIEPINFSRNIEEKFDVSAAAKDHFELTKIALGLS